MRDKLKICSLCKEEKLISEFNKNKHKKDNLQNHCRKCNKVKSRLYYENNKEKHRKVCNKRSKHRRKILRQFLYNFAAKQGCIDCGERNPICLDFDHVYKKNKSISSMIGSVCTLDSIVEELKNCVVRCANCHRKKTAIDFNWYYDLDKSVYYKFILI